MQLKNRLKELRARDGLNQTDLAKRAGVSRQTVSLLERDEYTPSIIIALKISQIFNETVGVHPVHYHCPENISNFQRNSRIGISLGGGRVMNKYKVIYYVVVTVLLVSVFLLIGIDLGWFSPYQSNQFIWAYFALIPVVDWIEKKANNLASEKGE